MILDRIIKIFNKSNIDIENRVLVVYKFENNERVMTNKTLVFLSKSEFNTMKIKFRIKKFKVFLLKKDKQPSLYLRLPSQLGHKKAKKQITKAILKWIKYLDLDKQHIKINIPLDINSSHKGYAIIHFNESVNFNTKCYLKALLCSSAIFKNYYGKCSWLRN